MKIYDALTKAALLTMICASVAGCSTSWQEGNKTARFHEASHVNVVLQFSSWDYTFMLQPRYDEKGFLKQVRRESIGKVFDGFNVPRDMAVVVIGWTYGTEDLNRLVAEWKSILGGCGFRRVVFLRSNAYNKLNGSLIIDDSNPSLPPTQATPPFQRAAP
jgi:hypothetical protein